MSFGDPELTLTPCPDCGSAEIFTAVALPGGREIPLYPTCLPVLMRARRPGRFLRRDTATLLCRFLPIISFFFKRSPAGWHL